MAKSVPRSQARSSRCLPPWKRPWVTTRAPGKIVNSQWQQWRRKSARWSFHAPSPRRKKPLSDECWSQRAKSFQRRQCPSARTRAGANAIWDIDLPYQILAHRPTAARLDRGRPISLGTKALPDASAGQRRPVCIPITCPICGNAQSETFFGQHHGLRPPSYQRASPSSTRICPTLLPSTSTMRSLRP